MKKLYIETLNLVTQKETLEKFLKDFYMRFYKKDRLKHLSRNDKRLPRIKVTDDIFSFPIYFKDKSQKEHRVFVDGTILLNEMKLSSITISGEEFNKNEYDAYLETFKELTSLSHGYILYANEKNIGRIKYGELHDYKLLMKEVYSVSPEERTTELKEIFRLMMEFDAEE